MEVGESQYTKGRFEMITKKKTFFVGVGCVVAFIIWTLLVCFVDKQAIGPQESVVGLATLNGWVHEQIGLHLSLYTLTDWLGLIPIGVAIGFAVFGLIQWIQRKSVSKVDNDILLLGGFYVGVMVVYVLFEVLVINYRPEMPEGVLEASYPSSTTMLALCIMPTAMMQCSGRIKNKTVRWCVMLIMAIFTAFMVIGRLLSGVHWLTDIIGGMLISAGLVLIYASMQKAES